jgi:hypothetical protein
MITWKNVLVRGFPDQQAAEQALVGAGIEPASGQWLPALGYYGWTGRFGLADPRWRALRAFAERAGLGHMTTELVEYTEAELRSAELLRVWANVERKGDTSPDFGDDYSFADACTACLTGARLLGPLHISRRDLPNKRPVAQTFLSHLLVREDLAKLLIERGVSREDLHSVVVRRTEELLPWRVVMPRVTLPRLHPATPSITQERPCPACKRDDFGWSSEPYMVPHYSRKAILDSCGQIPDLAASWERWGPGTRSNSEHRQIAPAEIFMSQRYAGIFADVIGRWIERQPTTLLD